MNLSHVTLELVDRIRSTQAHLQMESLKQLLTDTGNEYQIDKACFGDTIAFRSRRFPTHPFCNGTIGFTPADREHLPALREFHHEVGSTLTLGLHPGMLREELAQELASAGLYARSCSTVLYGLPTECSSKEDGVEVHEAEKSELHTVLDLWGNGFEHGATSAYLEDTETENGVAARICLQRMQLPGRIHFIATIDGTPCAMGSLTLRDGIGFLSAAATLPAFRGRRCQQALIAARMHCAAWSGCDLVVGESGFGLTSQRNMERCGMRIAYNSLRFAAAPPGG
jgi:hypothetical protein